MDNNKELIKKEYQSLEFPGALGGINRFLRELKKAYPDKNITLKQVKQAVEEIPIYNLHVQRRKKFKRRVIKRPPGAGICFQSDIIYLPNHKNCPYGLVLVDQYSRFIYLEPLKRKSGPAVQNALNKIIEENKLFKIKTIGSDRGTEYIYMKKFLKEKGIGLFFLENSPKASLAESSVKRIKKVMFLAMRQGKKILWPDIYQKVINQLNSRPLKVLGNKSPSEVNSPFDDIESKEFVEDKKVEQTGPIFAVGDLVFIELPKNLGEKEYDIARGVIARVKEVDKSAKPYMYKLESTEGKQLSRKYYGNELRRAPALRNIDKQIEKVFNSRRKNKKREYLVKFEGSRWDIFKILKYLYAYYIIYIFFSNKTWVPERILYAKWKPPS